MSEFNERARELFKGIAPQLSEILKVNATEAIETLGEIGTEATQVGAGILDKIAEASALYAEGQLDIEDLKIATSNYLDALESIKQEALNRGKAEAYDRSRRLLARFAKVASGILETGMTIGAVAIKTLVSSAVAEIRF